MNKTRLYELRYKVRQYNLIDEDICVNNLLRMNPLDKQARSRVETRAASWVEHCRSVPEKQSFLDAFLQEYSLSCQEGVALMCLAEALLRIPDKRTVDRLIAEKIHSGDWSKHKGKSENFFVNAVTLGLMLTRKIVRLDNSVAENRSSWLRKLVNRLSEPVIRFGVLRSMKFMEQQYVLGRSINEAMKRGLQENVKGTRFSFDMLGEGARTFEDAKTYFDAYMHAIHEIGNDNKQSRVYDAGGISVKLSALHPRYHYSQHDQVIADLLPKVRDLALEAKKLNISLTIDAEEATRLDISLDIFQALAEDLKLSNWDGLGFVLQAYQKRAIPLVDWLVELAKLNDRRLMIRLVKGAYWDGEIKHAQELGLPDYPVFTRKSHSDLSYQVCAGRLLEHKQQMYPQFATHNAYTIAMVLELAGEDNLLSERMEFQCLHGMGSLLHGQIASQIGRQLPLRIYAPVGNHTDLLPYLVRRLLENGANSSFINHFLDKKVPAEGIVRNVEDDVTALPGYRHSQIPLPKDIYRAANDRRANSRGIDLDDPIAMESVSQGICEAGTTTWQSGPIIGGNQLNGDSHLLYSPANKHICVGSYSIASGDDIKQALKLAEKSQLDWESSGTEHRAKILEKAADLLEERTELLTGLISLEAGRTLGDGISEVREAVDFCRYYATQMRELATQYPDTKCLHQGQGVFVCISPWNFPLAIFVGQVAAALASGNSVIAKPADQTPLIAGVAVKILHEAGVPGDTLHLLTGPGAVIGPQLLADTRVTGVAFTGSTETAKRIQIDLAKRGGTMPPLIAETGGQNVMFVDTTALPEQVVDDVINSAFLSAGQRCSALRVLFIQEEVADRTIRMLKGALKALNIGEPWQLSTDLGPVIDDDAKQTLLRHIKRMDREAIFIGKANFPENCPDGHYIEPHIYELNSISQLNREVFGPILHIIRYQARDLDKVLKEVNTTGYGLTMGIHSRIESFAREISSKTRIGNTYINRDMVGAVVGVNPFGGQGLSGTGFKAGGPYYLLRFTYLWKGAQIGHNDGLPSISKNAALTTDTEVFLQKARHAQWQWNSIGGEKRADILQALLNDNSVPAIAEETLSQCQELLKDTRIQFGKNTSLPGPTGETNTLSLHGRGVFLVLPSDNISTTVQRIICALATGNTVLIMSKENAINEKAYFNWLDKYLPSGVVSFVSRMKDMDALVTHNDLSGVTTCEHGSLVLQLAQREGAIIPLITHLNGPFRLLPYAVEKTSTNNVVATGGNAQLLNLQDHCITINN